MNDKDENKCLYNLPPKASTYFILSTETKGLNKDDQNLEVGILKVENGRLTTFQEHAYVHCVSTDENGKLVHKPGVINEFMNKKDNEFFMDDKRKLESISKDLGNSIIFAHNAPFHMNALNREFSFAVFRKYQ